MECYEFELLRLLIEGLDIKVILFQLIVDLFCSDFSCLENEVVVKLLEIDYLENVQVFVNIMWFYLFVVFE